MDEDRELKVVSYDIEIWDMMLKPSLFRLI